MVARSEQSCPVSGSLGPGCPVGHRAASVSRGRSQSQQTRGPRGCSFSGFCQPGDLHAAFNIPQGVDADEWLRMRERKSINQLLYSEIPSVQEIAQHKDQASIDALNATEQDVLAVALGAPARQVMIRAQEIGPKTGWRDGYLSMEHGFCPVDYDASAGALARSPGRVWSDLCERMPGCVARGRVRTTVAALPLVEGTEEVLPDSALWAALVALGLLCSIYRFEDKYDGSDGVTASDAVKSRPKCPMGDDLGEELVGIPLSIALPYLQVSRRMGRALPHLTFVDQSSYNLKIKDVTSNEPYLARFENTELRWPMFGERAEVTFLKGVADTSASFQHGPDAIAACQEHVMNRNVEGLLREMIRLKEILENMPGAFHSISTNPSAGENYVPVQQWVRWAKFSAPLSRRCPASSGLQFPPYLVMDAFLGRKKYSSFLGAEGVHLRAWLPSNLRAFIAAIEYHYRIPEFVVQSGDPRLMGVLDGIVEAYTGERGFMGVHRYKVFGILEVAAKTGRTETNGASGAADAGRPWEETHKQFSEAMKERLEPFRGQLSIEPHQMRGTFEECRYVARVQSRSPVDSDTSRSISLVTLDIRDTGITFMPGDRLALMPLNSWDECAKVAAALGLQDRLTTELETQTDSTWGRLEHHLASVHRETGPLRKLTVSDVLRRGHLAPITQSLALQLHERLQATSSTVLQVLATTSWPVCASLGDLLQAAVLDTPTHVWDRAFGLDDLSWLVDLVPPEVPRTYSIASYNDELLPSTVDLAVARSEYSVCPALALGAHGDSSTADMRAGVSSGFLNPWPARDALAGQDDILVGVSRPASFQLPLDTMAPCAFFAGGSGIAPFRSFWQSRLAASGLAGGSNYLFLGVQNRARFCFEDELRALVGARFMEVHVAFSRDSRGLSYDATANDLVEREIQPRYIDALILEQGATVCDLVMSKRQGGRGGHLYICGSVDVFDAVMNGIRRAIYSYRTATMESVDRIIDKAFAERRIMLDVFMSPKPLPCDRPTIPVSALAQHTGHRPDSRMWIAVHGSVYDVTDFCPMHPGGTLIIRSNAGGDCSESFDNLAHTNNPEVSSLLTKYFIGHLSPKPDFHAQPEVSALYDLWAAYLRTAVETLVAHQFEMYEIMGASADDSSAHTSSGSNNIWLRESLPNIIAVRTFYAYQSRLLQGGFAALFGAQMQQLVLRLSFALASTGAASGDTQLPDVLGTVARAKTSPDAASCTREVGRVGAFVCDPDASLRFHERGIAAYASKSVQLDIELLEDLRTEVCCGMDAFERVAATGHASENGDDVDAANESMLLVLSTFLLQSLERMARRLAVFYAQLAPCSVNHPELELNPARSRWALVRRYMRDGSLFVLASKGENNLSMERSLNSNNDTYYMSRQNPHQPIDFDRLMAQVQGTISQVPTTAADELPARPLTLNALHQERGRSSGNTSATARRENDSAMRAMSLFVEKNRKAIRRLSKLPPTALADLQAMHNNAENMAAAQQQQQHIQAQLLGMQGSLALGTLGPQGVQDHGLQILNTRGRGPASQLRQTFSDGRALSHADSRLLAGSRPPSLSRSSSRSSHDSALYPVIGGSVAPQIDAQQAMLAAMARMNTRISDQGKMQSRSRSASVTGGSRTRSPSILSHERMASMTSTGSVYRTKSVMSNHGHARNESGSWLRSFKLKGMVEANERKVAPTF
ncbi:sulfite reductase flavoprotein alpha-component [Ophiostoma piceae UAMH 11346]|uniref:NADPH--hemoprotein reductase n=1 Tax=Ophiostoma piceae (strain UAMH 11346) TaxID=1262450 RepID=S3BSH4_OPHP1|nr:sulfite reductase flavoprotein alpha-component [Ophiostoma piceae UAMH 11346]